MRMCGRESTLAVTSSSHGPVEFVAVLKKDGNCNLICRAYLACQGCNSGSLELGRGRHVRNSTELALLRILLKR
jgi:hypothetical protein